MSIFNSKQPKIDTNKFSKWLKENYTIFKNKELKFVDLNSERDKNFLVEIDGSNKFVVKISNPAEKKSFLELQDFVLDKLKFTKIHHYIPKKIHNKIKFYLDINKRKYFVRILTFMDGEMYAEIKHNAALEKSLGNFLGLLSTSLKNIGHPASFRTFEWNPSNIEWIKNEINIFENEDDKQNILSVLNEYNNFVKNNKKNLSYSLTHGDVNNYNLVVRNNEIAGLIDYGDMIYAPIINDLAIALAYALINKANILSTLKNIIVNYFTNHLISENDIISLMTLAKCRLALTVTIAAKNKFRFPDNDYLYISEKDAWILLRKLNRINPYFLIFIIRNFCSYEKIPNNFQLLNFLKTNTFSNIFDFNLNSVSKAIIKLDSDSKFTRYSNKNYSVKKIHKQIKTELIEQEAFIGIGLYGEKRKVYLGDNYQSLINSTERRNRHLGIDIFCEADTNVRSPLDGIVVILKNNSARFDYGPTVVLEHNYLKKRKFYTLYGHLDESCLKLLSLGKKIKKGDVLARVGNFPSNGNWPPHLHFQILSHLMEESENYAGVGEDSLWDVWSQLCPDPNLILKIPLSFFSQKVNTTILLQKRKNNIGHNLSISYDKHLQMLNAKHQYFFDDMGRKYLDAVNNISHVGHSHPHVHEALIKQNELLNTNTRYIYEIMIDYSEKLLQKFPKNLDTIYFVCSGSEANDLAYRMALTFTKGSEVLVMDNAYHGNTTTLIDLSPYKFNGPGGLGKQNYVHVAPMPDGIRGLWKYENKNMTANYIETVKKIINSIQKQNKILSCFFIESILGCGGQMILPDGYLKEVFKELSF